MSASSLIDPAGPLIGRAEELAAIEAALAGHRLVTLTGLGGIGKTRVAMEIVARSPTALPARFVDLAPVAHPDAVPEAIAAELEVGESRDTDLATAIGEALARGPSLLVLDNFEHVASAAGLVQGLLERASPVRILVTSRARLGLAGELEIPLGALPVPSSAATLESTPSSRLFLERARDRGSLRQVDADDAQAIVELCRRLDGLPLALELAARWTALLTPRAILRRLEEQRIALAQEGRPRHASLDQVVESTLRLLAGPDRAAFEACGVFVGWFDETAAAAIAPSADVLDALRRLESVGLMRAGHDDDGEPRFAMLETVRAVARSRIRGTGAAEEVRRRYVSHFAARAVAAAGRLRVRSFSDGGAEGELADPNTRAAFDAAVELGAAQPAVELAAAMASYAIRTGILREAAQRVGFALAMGPVPPAIESDGLTALVSLRGELGQRDGLPALTERAMLLARAAGARDLEVRTLISHAMLGDAPDAEAILAEAATLADAIGYRWGAAVAYHNLGQLRSATGRLEAALDAYRRACDAFLAQADPVGAAFALASAGEMSANLDRVDEAIDALRQARLLRGGGGGQFMVAFQIGILAAVESLAGRRDDAYADLLEAAEMRTVSDSESAIADWLDAATTVLAVEHPVAAARALGAVDRIVELSGQSRPSQRLRERAAKKVERVIGRRRLESERDVGRRTDPSILLDQLEVIVRRGAPAAHGRLRGRFGTLTAREQEVLSLLARGRTDPEIADRLGISAKTASVHVANIKAKLGADSRVEAALIARDLVGTGADHAES